MRFSKQNRPASDSQLLSFEEMSGFQLPIDYRRFLGLSNGGWNPDRHVCRYINPQGRPDIASVHQFYGLGYELEQAYVDYQESIAADFPKQFLEIGHDSFGNVFLLSLREFDFGHVYFWETDWDFQLPGEEHPSVAHLANSFTEFLELLTEE
jgi:hypothetical protein